MKQDLLFYIPLVIFVLCACISISYSEKFISNLKARIIFAVLYFLSLLFVGAISITLYESKEKWNEVEKYERVNEPIYRLKK